VGAKSPPARQFDLGPSVKEEQHRAAIRDKNQWHGAPTMGISKRNEGKKVNSNINVTPMVDVMLVLLIIFMVITPMLQQKVQSIWPEWITPRTCRTPTRKMRLSWPSREMAPYSLGRTRLAV
jgi:hypothetical protein